MSKRDITSTEYLSDGNRLADFLNVIVFCGEEVVCPDQIREMDTSVRSIWRRYGRVFTRSMTRDILVKMAVGMKYLIIGVESQNGIDYGIPVRVMAYDAEAYQNQIRKKRRTNRWRKVLRGDEYLSGIGKDEKLAPVVTLILYFGETPWDDPTDLHGILELGSLPKKVREWIPNYELNVIDVRRYPNWELFRTDLRQLFGYMSHLQGDIVSYINSNREEYQDLAEDTYDMICSVTRARDLKEMKLENITEDGGVDMCNVIDSLKIKWKEEGIEQGIGQGKAETIAVIRRKLSQGLSAESIAYWTGLDEAYVRKVAVLHGKYPQEDDIAIAQRLLAGKDVV